MTKTQEQEQAQVLEEMKEMGKALRALGIDFIICLNTGQNGQVHNISTDMNVQDDHHVLDMVACITETWWKANHST